MKRKIIWVLVSCLMTAALVLSSCATAEEKEKPGAGPEMVKLSLKKLDGTTVEKMVEKPKYGGTFNQGSAPAGWAPPTHFDEGQGLFITAWTIFRTNETLTQGDWARGPEGTGEAGWMLNLMPAFKVLEGCLAESWDLSEPGKIIFHIRKGVHFHDKPPTNGREMTAEDVAWSFNRLAFESPRAFQSAYAGFFGDDGYMKATDKWTVEMKCLPAYWPTIFRVYSTHTYVSPHEVVDEYGDFTDWRNSCGTGPFMLTDYVTGSTSTLVRNPNYWQKDPLFPENQLPYMDTLKHFYIQDLSTQMAALRTGKVDHMMYVTAEDAKSVLNYCPDVKWTRGLQIHPNNSLWFKVAAAPFDDIRVRRALAMALDTEAIAENYYLGEAVILNNPVPPVKEYDSIYVPLDQLAESSRELYEYHPDKAKQLLAEAGYPQRL